MRYDETIKCRVSGELHDAFRAKCISLEMPESEVMRVMIEGFVCGEVSIKKAEAVQEHYLSAEVRKRLALGTTPIEKVFRTAVVDEAISEYVKSLVIPNERAEKDLAEIGVELVPLPPSPASVVFRESDDWNVQFTPERKE
jgi:hypothetical protein